MDDLDAWMSAASRDDDRAAYTQVVEACQHLLRAVALQATADLEAADEIAQEALVRGWERRQQYRLGSSPKAWLLAMVRSLVLDRQRREKRNQRHLPELIRAELRRHRDCVDEEQLRQDRLDALDACLQHMPEEQHALLRMVHHEGLSTEDAALAIGISPVAGRQRLSRIQRALRSCIEERLQSQNSSPHV